MDAVKVTELYHKDKEIDFGAYLPEVQLSTFLYTGEEFAIYDAGNMLLHNYLLTTHLTCIEELAKVKKKELLPMEMIKMAFESNLVPHPETLIFALAVCCKQNFSENLRCAAFAVISKICSSPEHFILFIKFASLLNKLRGIGYSRGWGHGFRKAVNNWYLSKDPLELAKCVTQCKGRYGWKHKDIVKLSHPHPDTPEKEVIFKYVMHGLEEAKRSFGGNPDITDLIEYIQKFENFKHCEDVITAAGTLEKYKFTLDHVPGHMLESAEIWNSLIPSMNLYVLLNNLQRIHNLGLLKSDSPTIEKIIHEITNKENLLQNNVNPVFVYIILKNYENSRKPLTSKKRKIKKQAIKPFPPPPKPNTKIINALHQAFNLSIMNLETTGLRYMITINANDVMWKTSTWRNGIVNGVEAGLLIAHALSYSEKYVTVAAFDIIDLCIIDLKQTSCFPSVMRVHQPIPNNVIYLSTPISWALKKHAHYDVFINVVDQIVHKDDDYECERSLAVYRDKMNLPHAKLINCIVCSSRMYKGSTYSKDILTIYGFDATIPMVIQAFSKSLF